MARYTGRRWRWSRSAPRMSNGRSLGCVYRLEGTPFVVIPFHPRRGARRVAWEVGRVGDDGTVTVVADIFTLLTDAKAAAERMEFWCATRSPATTGRSRSVASSNAPASTMSTGG